jgi:hypothetical protein
MNIKKILGWTALVVVLLATHIVAGLQGLSMGWVAHNDKVEMECVHQQYTISKDGLIFACALVGIAQSSEKK